MNELEKRVVDLEENDKKQEVCIHKMAVQVDEMYKVFTRSSWATKKVISIFAAIGIITGAVIGVIELLKRLGK